MKPQEYSFPAQLESTTSHLHEMTTSGTGLEPVPEGCVAQSYYNIRTSLYHQDITSFLPSTVKKVEAEAEEAAEEEESDLDAEEIESDSTSASEGSQDIEPFPLPPAPPDVIRVKSQRSVSLCRELHEVLEETEGGSIAETSSIVYSAPLTPVTPVRLAHAMEVERPEPIEAPTVEQEQAKTASKKSRSRRRTGRRRKSGGDEGGAEGGNVEEGEQCQVAASSGNPDS